MALARARCGQASPRLQVLREKLSPKVRPCRRAHPLFARIIAPLPLGSLTQPLFPGTPQPVVLEDMISLARRDVRSLARRTTLKDSLEQVSFGASGNAGQLLCRRWVNAIVRPCTCKSRARNVSHGAPSSELFLWS